jgi:hypothetical protein
MSDDPKKLIEELEQMVYDVNENFKIYDIEHIIFSEVVKSVKAQKEKVLSKIKEESKAAEQYAYEMERLRRERSVLSDWEMRFLYLKQTNQDE